MQALSRDQQAWVEKTLGGLSLREKVGQLLFPMLTEQTAAPLGIARYVAETGIGGGHMFGGPMAKCRRTAGEAQGAAAIPLLVSGDFEVGPGERIPEGTHLPGRMAIGAVGDERLSYEAGKVTALEATACGYNLAFGPIVDLAAVKDYQRQVDSLGRRPEEVARLGAACVRGLQDHGMAACAKHFPGDGFDDRDQHLMTLVNPLSPAEWRRQSALPFKAAIDAGVMSIMVSCIGLPSMDPEAGDPRNPMPAVTSRYLVTELLRGELGFEGVIITDALNMGGVSYHYRERDRYRMALRAGNDILLFVRNVPRVLEDLVGCVERGEIDEGQVEASARRVLELKARLNLHKRAMPDEAEAQGLLGSSPGRQVAQEISERSVTLLRDSRGTVPLKLGKGSRVAVVLVTNQPAERFSLDVFEGALRESGVEVTSIRDPQTDQVHDQVAAGGFDAVIMALYFPVQYGWNTVRMHGPYSRCVMSGFAIADAGAQAVYVSFSNPYHVYELPQMDPYLVTYGGSPAAQRAAATALVGRTAIRGRIPCELDGFFGVGDGVQRGATR
ncbi:MAG TPA: glycoside hydrolase family 3 N-terminal domain-containing protein [Phycisphaerae bacterium]|nr:glycoside hydrolase family 3 N-terminal domain-containing protein [Phycisphaerae bacterium]